MMPYRWGALWTDFSWNLAKSQTYGTKGPRQQKDQDIRDHWMFVSVSVPAAPRPSAPRPPALIPLPVASTPPFHAAPSQVPAAAAALIRSLFGLAPQLGLYRGC